MRGTHNGSINLGLSDTNASSKGTFLRWNNTSKKEELGFTNRLYQIENLNSSPKRKSNAAIQNDRAIATIINQHKKGKITSRELLTKYMNLTSEHSLPKDLRRIDHVLI